jgi:hypothetical protein
MVLHNHILISLRTGAYTAKKLLESIKTVNLLTSSVIIGFLTHALLHGVRLLLFLFMSMGADYVPELCELFFIPQTIYEYGQPRLNDTGRENLKNLEKSLSVVPICSPQIPHGLTGA